MKQGDIYYVSLDPVRGHEQSSERPVIVVSPRQYNDKTGLPYIAPITNGGDFATRRGLMVDLSGRCVKIQGGVRIDQVRPLDLKARKARFVESAPASVVIEIIAKLGNIFSVE